MAQSNHQRVGEALTHLRDAIQPVLTDHWGGKYGMAWLDQVNETSNYPDKNPNPEDLSFLLNGMLNTWFPVLKDVYPIGLRNYIYLLRDARNSWAHQEKFSSSETIRILDQVEIVLQHIKAHDQEKKVAKSRKELQHTIFSEETRQEKRKIAAQATRSRDTSGLPAWRELIVPHADVREGKFEESEYAAHLWQVVKGEASEEYQDPEKFFARTYITEGIRDLIRYTAERLSGRGANPVINLQTNFGGGKTHSLIALYHLVSGVPTNQLVGVDVLLQEENLSIPDQVNRATFIGNKVSVSSPDTVEDGTKLHTIWGRLAYQIGGKEGYQIVENDDLNATNPGIDKLVELFRRFGPILILIDEWVAYARDLQARNGEKLAGGNFDTQFSFAQSLTEAASGVDNTLVVISLPISEKKESSFLEVGGHLGQEALNRLKNVVDRVASHWRPASTDESFEIVRRRLFEDMPADHIKQRDTVVDSFISHYKENATDFPRHVTEGVYKDRMKLAYPIHPEFFDRLFQDWSTLERFQRTRGVLRFMSIVIHQLWVREDRNLMILPGHIPLDNNRVMSELYRHLPDAWEGIIRSDIDGDSSLPLRLDQDRKNLGQYSAARRVARTIYLGSAPHHKDSPGIERAQIMLGCSQTKENPGVFNDALRALSTTATYLHMNGTQYWFSTNPTLNRIADDLAKDTPLDVADNLAEEILRGLVNKRNFPRVHIFPSSPDQVSDDDQKAGLVVLPLTHPYTKSSEPEGTNEAEVLANTLAEKRLGENPREYQNLLIFLAADSQRVADLRESLSKQIAWQTIYDKKGSGGYDLEPSRVEQVEAQLKTAKQTVLTRLNHTFSHVMSRHQEPGGGERVWHSLSLRGDTDLFRRAHEKITNDEFLIPSYSPVRIRMDLDKYLTKEWKENGHITLERMWECYAKFLYMPTLVSSQVLLDTIRNMKPDPKWRDETFAVAEAYDEDQKRYRGLVAGEGVNFVPTLSTLIVHPDAVMTEPFPIPGPGPTPIPGPGPVPQPNPVPVPGPEPDPEPRPKRYYARSALNGDRIVRSFGQIAEEVVPHLRNTPNTEVMITIEIEAKSLEGFDESTIRTVIENARTLGIEISEFEEE